ncbi:MAG: Gfo/Idh/MocA family oxidoreductase [Acidimicrobiia bacterium]|nr:Gfo/Idh/MocA family oxidoreductase [Acidimicrobiia bacterium]
MSDPIRLAAVGLGRWARVLAAGIQRSDQVELYSCFTRNADRRRAFQQDFGIPRAAATYEDLLADPDVEGVVITTPNDTHRDVIAMALDAGKGVYTDKPIAQTLEDALAIKQSVDASDSVFAVGHSARRLSGCRVMKRWIDDGTLGGVTLAESNFSNERGLELTPDTWRWYLSKTPGGPLIQLGVHHADNLQYLLGPVAAVTAHQRKLFTDAEVPDATMAILEFESGALGYLGCGWASPGIYQMRLQGTKRNLMYDLDFTHWDASHEADTYSSLVSQEYGQHERTPVALPATDMFREQLEEFGNAIRGEGEVEVGADDAIRALAVVHTAIESDRNGGRAVEVKPFLDAVGVTAA